MIVKADVVVVVPVPKKLKVIVSKGIELWINGCYLERTLQSGEAGMNMC